MDDIVYIVGAAGGTTESSGGSSVSINADYKNPGDFSVTRRDENTLGLSTITTPVRGVRSIDFVYLKILRADGSIELIVNGVDDSFAYVAGDPTTSGELSFTSTVLLETDTAYEVGVNGATSSVESLTALISTNALSGITMQANHFSPADFVVSYASATTLTVSGAPFTVGDDTCFVLSIMVKLADNSWKKYINGQNGVSIYSSANTIYITGNTDTAFLQSDLAYRVAINYQQKAFDPSTNTMMVIEQAPNRAAYIQDSIADSLTNVANGTTYDLSMDGYKDLSLTGYLIDAEETSFTVSATNDEDTTDSNAFNIIYGYDAVNNTLVNSVAATNETKKFALDFDNLNFSTVRITITSALATNTVNIKARRKA